MLTMQISNSQVAIAGRVLERETKEPISGAMVEIIEMPEKFNDILSLKALQYGTQWEKMSVRPDRKITASDGSFYFVNLPPGEYKLKASLLGSGTRYKNREQEIIVKDVNQTLMTEIDLLPTGIKGTITDADEQNKAIVNAKVQIQGSPESTFSDQKGNYLLLGLEASKSESDRRTVIVSATGYQQQVSQPLEIQQGEVISNQNFSLNPQ